MYQAMPSNQVISTHAPAGGATMSARCLTRRLKFLLTPLREGRPSRRPTCNTSTAYFYSRPCGRGDKYALVTHSHVIAISTHAPAGGATTVTPFWLRWLSLFLLTPLREGRRIRNWNKAAPSAISTHAPAGGATGTNWYQAQHSYISTHAPAGGATMRGPRFWRTSRYFYSRPCGRGDRSTA